MKNTNEIKDFQIYLHEARNKFVTDICKHKWDNEIRRSAEDFLIAHDQLADRYFKMLSENNLSIRIRPS